MNEGIKVMLDKERILHFRPKSFLKAMKKMGIDFGDAGRGFQAAGKAENFPVFLWAALVDEDSSLTVEQLRSIMADVFGGRDGLSRQAEIWGEFLKALGRFLREIESLQRAGPEALVKWLREEGIDLEGDDS
jgi:hypothetical protein